MPGSFTKGLARYSIGMTGTAAQLKTTSDALVMKSSGDYNAYSNRMNAINDVGTSGINYFSPEEMSSVDRDYAYFFARDKDRELTLFQIEKNTGKEKARYLFDDKSPVYKVNYVNNKLYYTNGATLKIYELEK